MKVAVVVMVVVIAKSLSLRIYLVGEASPLENRNLTYFLECDSESEGKLLIY